MPNVAIATGTSGVASAISESEGPWPEGQWFLSTFPEGDFVGSSTQPNGWSVSTQNGCGCVYGPTPVAATALISVPSNAGLGTYFFELGGCLKHNTNPPDDYSCVLRGWFDVVEADTSVSGSPNPCGEM